MPTPPVFTVEPLETAGLVNLTLSSPEDDRHTQAFTPEEAHALANELLRAAADVRAA